MSWRQLRSKLSRYPPALRAAGTHSSTTSRSPGSSRRVPFSTRPSSSAAPRPPRRGRRRGRPAGPRHAHRRARQVEGVVADRQEQREHVGAADHRQDAVIDAELRARPRRTTRSPGSTGWRWDCPDRGRIRCTRRVSRMRLRAFSLGPPSAEWRPFATADARRASPGRIGDRPGS